MISKTPRDKAILFSAALFILVQLPIADAQDVDVPGNLTMTDSTATQGNILKDGVPFLHNFGPNNTFLGSNAGNLTMSGSENTATGNGALLSNTTGGDNTATGAFALGDNTTGIANTAAGAFALGDNTSGVANTATGFQALGNNTSGVWNTATGFDALVNNTTGNQNTVTGFDALVKNTTGNSNTAIGSQVLPSNATGSYNTAIGAEALYSNIEGSFNTAFGFGAGANLRSGDNNVYVLHAGANESNTIRIGNPSHTRFFAAGVRAVVAGDHVCINSDYQLGICFSGAASDDVRRQQREIQELRARLEALERAIGNPALTKPQ